MDAKVTEPILDLLNELESGDCDADQAGTIIQQIRERVLAAESQIAEMRIVTGPECPGCGHWLKAEHDLLFPTLTNTSERQGYVCEYCDCGLTVTDLLANHPLIAAELGLEANDGR